MPIYYHDLWMDCFDLKYTSCIFYCRRYFLGEARPHPHYCAHHVRSTAFSVFVAKGKFVKYATVAAVQSEREQLSHTTGQFEWACAALRGATFRHICEGLKGT